MRAVRFEAFGDPSVLNVVEAATPPVREGIGAGPGHRGLDQSERCQECRRERCGRRRCHAIPGRDFAGVVEAGPAEWLGAEVWGTGGDAGFTRDGSHAELIAVPVEKFAPEAQVRSISTRPRRSASTTWPPGAGLEAAVLRRGESRAADRRGRRRRRRRRADRATPRRARHRRRQTLAKPRRAGARYRGEADHRGRGPAGRSSRGHRTARARMSCLIWSAASCSASAVNSLAVRRQAHRARRDRPARSELRPR